MLGWIKPFVGLIGLSRIATLGAGVVTATALAEIALILGELLFFQHNPYLGIVAYMILPGGLVFGLAIIPLGIWLKMRKYGTPFDPSTVETMRAEGVISRPGRILSVVLVLTLVNLLLFSLLGYRGFHYMESTAFCGQLCHEVMIPEFTAYQDSPHSEVECVQCHIGPGADWFVRSKLSGARQVFAVLLDTYHKPIQTPIENLRPAREVCNVCHRPEMFHGDLIRELRHFKPDKQNTPTYTVLNMRVGGIGPRAEASGIHWHISRDEQLYYYATDRKRENIVRIEQRGPDGEVHQVWQLDPMPADVESRLAEEEPRRMDCVDCHNRPTHIYRGPVEAIERRMRLGQLDPDLPWIRNVAEEVLRPHYETREQAMEAIESRTLEIYRSRYPDLWRTYEPRIRDAIETLKAIHRRNVFPQMKIQWHTYVSLIGHPTAESGRCFRCHGSALRNEQGESIDVDCATCHYVLARDSEDPGVLKVLRGTPAFYGGVGD